MPKAAKLPNAKYLSLAAACKKGIPEDGPGETVCQDLLEKVRAALQREYKRPPKKLASARDTLYVLNTLGSALMFDGLIVGVACNEPELIAPAIELCKKLEFPKTAKVLKELARRLAPATIRDAGKRLDYYQDPARVDAMEALESKSNDCEPYAEGWYLPSVQLLLDHPSDFFVMPKQA